MHFLIKRIRWLDRLQSQEKRAKFILSRLTGSFLLDGGTLHPCFDDDINNDANSFYVEIIDKNRKRMHDLWPKVVEERKTRNLLELYIKVHTATRFTITT